jgi:16S rRNA (cytosine967-C5)-methyltransferase
MVDQTKNRKAINAREAAYLAVLDAQRNHRFVEQSLSQWEQAANPTSLDFAFAQEIAYGSVRMALALDHLAAQLADDKSLRLKQKEKALLRTALYQHRFMDRVPLYAIVNESVNLAKKHCGTFFAKFLHAILRKLETAPQQLPEGNDSAEMSVAHSYPLEFVNHLIQTFDEETAKEVMDAGNTVGPVMVRLRLGDLPKGLSLVKEAPLPVARLDDKRTLPQLITSSDYYIQNATPVALMENLAQDYPIQPKQILDLCAAPGGKLLIAHDLYPNAVLHANDVSEKKLQLLRDNFKKYNLPVNLTLSPGEKFESHEQFDLILVDAPCSNTGVLNKRPEARWRLDKENVAALQNLQIALIKHAAELLTPEGQIWYMTCSILPQENEWVIEQCCAQFRLQMVKPSKTILPNRKGWDGGFACALIRTSPYR